MAGAVKRIAVNILSTLAFLLVVFAVLKWLFGGEKRCRHQ